MLLVPATTQSRTSASRVSLVVGYIVMLLAPVTMGAGGPVLMGVLAAAFGLVPLLLGPARYRVLGVFPLVIGAAVAVDAYPQARKEMGQYAVRGQLTEVVSLGTTIATALDRHRVGAPSLPKSIDELGVSAPREKVANVRIKSENHFTIGLALPAVSGKELVFVAVNVDGARTWKCMSRGLEHRYRPAACREDIDASLQLDEK
jgi:hypothetical protein